MSLSDQIKALRAAKLEQQERIANRAHAKRLSIEEARSDIIASVFNKLMRGDDALATKIVRCDPVEIRIAAYDLRDSFNFPARMLGYELKPREICEGIKGSVFHEDPAYKKFRGQLAASGYGMENETLRHEQTRAPGVMVVNLSFLPKLKS